MIYKVNILDAKTGIVGRFGWLYNEESNNLKKNVEKYLFEHEEIEKNRKKLLQWLEKNSKWLHGDFLGLFQFPFEIFCFY